MRYARTIAAARANWHIAESAGAPALKTGPKRYKGELSVRACAILLALLIWAFAGGALIGRFG